MTSSVIDLPRSIKIEKSTTGKNPWNGVSFVDPADNLDKRTHLNFR